VEAESAFEIDEDWEDAGEGATGPSLWPLFVVVALVMIGVGTWRVLDENSARDEQTRAVAKARADGAIAQP
jgi:hypothetical protein